MGYLLEVLTGALASLLALDCGVGSRQEAEVLVAMGVSYRKWIPQIVFGS